MAYKRAPKTNTGKNHNDNEDDDSDGDNDSADDNTNYSNTEKETMSTRGMNAKKQRTPAAHITTTTH